MAKKSSLFPAKSNPKLITRSNAWMYLLINQLAFPGMGTVMAGQWVGYIQCTIMLAGFFLSMGFMFCYFASLFSFIAHSQGAPPRFVELCRPYAWAGISGLGLCIIAWCWAMVSSLFILRAATAAPPPCPPSATQMTRAGENEKN